MGIHDLCNHLHDVVHDVLKRYIGDRVSPVTISRMKYSVQDALQPLVNERVIRNASVREVPLAPSCDYRSLEITAEPNNMIERIVVNVRINP